MQPLSTSNLFRAFTLLLATLFPSSGQAAIFGADDRLPLPPGSPQYEASRSVALAILSSNFEESAPGKLKLDPGSLSKYVCEDEKFSSEPSMSYACTGFLVGPDLIATAGHCMVNTGESRNEKENYCEAYSWLFDYRNGPDGKVELENVPADRLYKCKQIIYAIKEETEPYRDFALVQLDREVKDRTPFSLATGPAQQGVYHMIGHPLGLPLKLSRHAFILKNDRYRESFLTNLDAFEGNSGSPVFNRSGAVAGILVGGTPSLSLYTDPKLGCERYNRCAENGFSCTLPDKDVSKFPGYQGVGSEVQRIAPIQTLISEFEKTRAN